VITITLSKKHYNSTIRKVSDKQMPESETPIKQSSVTYTIQTDAIILTNITGVIVLKINDQRFEIPFELKSEDNI